MKMYDESLLEKSWEFHHGKLLGPIKKAAEINGGAIVDFDELETLEGASEFVIPPVPINGRDLSGPLFEPDVEGFFLPYISDSFSTAVTMDAWDWQSSELLDHKDIPVVSERAALEADLIQEKRGCVVWNLYETEDNYTRILGTIQEQGDLHEFHLSFLDELYHLLLDWDPAETGIGFLFKRHAESLSKLYTRFIDNYAISQKCIKKEEKENPDFQSFIKEASKSSENNRQTLKDILITPVQRTARYHLLLKDLLKDTPETHPDYLLLQKAWKQMTDLATVVNEKKRKEEEATGLFDAFEQTKHCPPTLISHRRRMIFSVECLCPKSNRGVKVILCSDLLMLSLINNNKSKLSGLTRSGTSNAGPEHNYRFLRWLDLLEIEQIDMHAIRPNHIRITVGETIDQNRKSNTTPFNEIPPQAKELGGSSFLLVFTGYDPSKSRTNFLHAVEAMTKLCKDEESGI